VKLKPRYGKRKTLKRKSIERRKIDLANAEHGVTIYEVFFENAKKTAKK